VIPGTGLSFPPRVAEPGAIPGHLNALAPGKSGSADAETHSCLRRTKPWLPWVTPGGTFKCRPGRQVLIGMLDLGRTPREAIEAPTCGDLCNSPVAFCRPHERPPQQGALQGDMPEKFASKASVPRDTNLNMARPNLGWRRFASPLRDHFACGCLSRTHGARERPKLERNP